MRRSVQGSAQREEISLRALADEGQGEVQPLRPGLAQGQP